MERGDIVLICTWVGMANTNGSQDYPSLNPTRGVEINNYILICSQMYLIFFWTNNNNNVASSNHMDVVLTSPCTTFFCMFTPK